VTYAVRFVDVTKRYPRGRTEGEAPRYPSLRYDLASIGKRLGARVRGRTVGETGTLALKGISFEVEEGESFALIGPNGAGKSTALKLISRVSFPTSGRITTRGRVAALMEVGSGVHPELTGRENIWLYGQILGMSRAYIRRRFDEIVAFAEIEHALDTPVKFFSSGMQLRLGFSIAAHLEPDVFVVDEALAVGDARFQAKCIDRMSGLVTEGHTLLFVSHDLLAVEAVCTRGAFLLGGQIEAVGTQREALKAYLDWVDTKREGVIPRDSRRGDPERLQLERVSMHAADGQERDVFRTGEDVLVKLRFHATSTIHRPHISLGISDGRRGNLVACSMLVDGGAPESISGSTEVTCRMRNLPLMPRTYHVWSSVRSEDGLGEIFEWQPVGVLRFTSDDLAPGPMAQALTPTDGPVFVEHDWKVDPLG
jgi:ABC-type polysaccharide/polyol phosphate transport system ATPase subunit